MKRGKEKEIALLEDMSVVNGLLILALTLLFLLDIFQRQWILWILLVLGLILNLTVAACGMLRRKRIVCILALVLFFGLCGSMIYLGMQS